MTGGSSSKSKSKGKSKGKGKQDSGGGGGASVDYHDAMEIVNIESYWTEMQV